MLDNYKQYIRWNIAKKQKMQGDLKMSTRITKTFHMVAIVECTCCNKRLSSRMRSLEKMLKHRWHRYGGSLAPQYLVKFNMKGKHGYKL